MDCADRAVGVMTSRKFTPPFSGQVAPARVGVYERNLYSDNFRNPMRFAHWDGKHWHACRESVSNALLANRSGYQLHSARVQWRGLAQDPKERS